MATHYIGADVDGKMTNLAVERNGRIIQELCVPTTIPSLAATLGAIGRPRKLAFEEGGMAHWLARNLRPIVDDLIVCDPRRNALISSDGDSDDRVDARKLAELLRGGHLRAVYHSDNDDHTVLKQWVAIYHDRVKDGVRQINKLRALCMRHGVRPARGALRNPPARQRWLGELGEHPAVTQLQVLFVGYDAVAEQVRRARAAMAARAGAYPIIAKWQELPGVALIRASTLYAYLDTPWRFRNNPHGLCKYCGIGLQHAGSGKNRDGSLNEGRVHLAWQGNRRLKNVMMGAAVSAVRQGDNVFAEQYERLVSHGMTPNNALHTVARKMLTVMWGMWKTDTRFDPRLVCGR